MHGAIAERVGERGQKKQELHLDSTFEDNLPATHFSGLGSRLRGNDVIVVLSVFSVAIILKSRLQACPREGGG